MAHCLGYSMCCGSHEISLQTNYDDAETKSWNLWPFSSAPSAPTNLDVCHGQKSRFFGDGHPTFNRNPSNGYINPYNWVDDYPLLYGNNGSFDPGTCSPCLPLDSRCWKFPVSVGFRKDHQVLIQVASTNLHSFEAFGRFFTQQLEVCHSAIIEVQRWVKLQTQRKGWVKLHVTSKQTSFRCKLAVAVSFGGENHHQWIRRTQDRL